MSRRGYAIRVCSDVEPEARWRRGADPDCPNDAAHTLCPSGYLAWHAWADRTTRTHRQVRCDGCGLLSVWVPK